MRQIKTLIFDLDGVIVDTAKFHYQAWKALAAELGFEFTEKHNERLKGVSRMKSLEILLEVGGLDFDEETKQKLAFKKNEHYKELIKTLTPADILPGANELLDEAKKMKLKTALGSASKNAKTILKNIGLLEAFDVIIDGTMVQKAKPNPEVFLLAAEKTRTQPENCIVFEDAEAGILAAKNANMIAIGIGDKKILNNADIVVRSLKEISLLQICKQLNINF